MIKTAKQIQKIFKEFYLAGGTAIMLKYSHRKSIDLDFFRQKPFSFRRLTSKFRNHFPVEREEQGIDNLDIFTKGMKISFIFFPYANIEDIQYVKGIYMASDYDLFLNKIYVAGRRIESKDAFDVAYLYSKHKWSNVKLKGDFERKFSDQSYEIYLGALLKFEDYEPLKPWIKESLMKLMP